MQTLEPVAELTRGILRLGVAADAGAHASSEAAHLRGLLFRSRAEAPASTRSAADVDASLVHLHEHRLLGFAYWALGRHALLEGLSADVSGTLRAQYEHTRALSAMQQLTLRGVSAKFRPLGIQPVACKGIVLQSDYYPDPGMRFMHDLDLWVPGDFRLACESVLLQLGFRPLPRHLPDGGNYRNTAGVTIDLHWRMRLFEGTPGGFESLTVEAPSGGFRIFEPHALLTHLCVHMLGHYPDTGPMLCWLLDLGFVLRKVGHQIDVARLQALMPSPRHWLGFLRSVGLLAGELGFVLPLDLARAAERVEPLSFVSALRLRRLALWGLPSLPGWGRLLASLARVRDADGVPLPTFSDLSRWPLDWAQHWWLGHRIR